MGSEEFASKVRHIIFHLHPFRLILILPFYEKHTRYRGRALHLQSY